jgi:hypothetical protein
MGKKRTLQQANLQHEEDEVEELDAEIRALAAMREEKVIAISGKTPSSHYNNEVKDLLSYSPTLLLFKAYRD